MRNKYVALVAFLGFSILANGQQAPNAGFEVWTNPAQPDGWYTYSSGGFANLAGKDTTNKVEGNASAKIRTETSLGATIFEILSLGTADYAFTGGGVVYTYFPVYFPYRPDSLIFAYQYTSPGTDTATAYIKLSKGTTTLAEAELSLIKNAQWSYSMIDLTPLYANSDTPDSLLIQFKSSKMRSNFFGVGGSTLNIDDVHFRYAGTAKSAPELTGSFRASIIPNPFSAQLTLTLAENEPTTVSVYDFLGQQVLQQTFTNSTTINTEQLADGIYLYELRSNNGSVKTGKLIKQ